MKVIITGAGGFVGTYVCNYFHKNNWKVVGWDRLEKVGLYPIKKVDMLCEKQIDRELQIEKPDLIVHCAGSADVGKSVTDPYMDYSGNVTITHNLLFSMHRANMTGVRLIFLSSAAVYGNPEKLPIKENAVVKPLSPYALHKVMCESICQYMHNNYNMDIKILRIFSAYGVGLKKQIFWDMQQKITNTGSLKMYGTGNESRDYINIEDLVESIYLVATKAPKNELVYNVANGEETTIRYATMVFAQQKGIDESNIVFTGESKEGNPINWRADISKIKELGYHKSVDFELGVQRYVSWLDSGDEK